MKVSFSFARLSDAQLTQELSRLSADERRATTRLVACLEQFDRRRLYLARGFPSLFAYCTDKLHMSEDAACRRIAVARAMRRHPRLAEMLHDGRLSITTAGLLVQRLPPVLVDAVLERAAFKTKRQVELLIATAQPQPAVPAVIRKLPEPKPAALQPATRQPEALQPAAMKPAALLPTAMTPEATPQAPTGAPPLAHLAPLAPLAPPHAPAGLLAPPIASPSRRAVVAPLSESHYKLQVTITAAARARLQQLQDLMRHRLPGGDPAAIVEYSFEALHRELIRQKAADVAKPRPGISALEVKGRHIPAAVMRAVWRRDGGACAFIAADGKRCSSASGVEFHHVRPFAVGGTATLENIELRCRAHNGFEWERHLDAETEALISG